MDEIAKIIGRDVSEVSEPTVGILSEYLIKNREKIEANPLKSYKYGPLDRHWLDIIYPLEEDKLEKTPILVFEYGGGFNSGERNLSKKFGLVYRCVGAFFARRGIVTVIADYRLAPGVQYPKPVEDIRDAVQWVVDNPQELVSPGSPSPDLNNIILMGHSAGAAHVATLILETNVLPLDSDLRRRITGLIPVGGGYIVKAAVPGSERAKLIEQYWGTLDFAKQHDPSALLARFPESGIGGLPRILMSQAEWEPDYLAYAGDDIKKELEARIGRPIKRIIAMGHNHASMHWVLGIGEGEEWAEDVAEWILTEPSKRP